MSSKSIQRLEFSKCRNDVGNLTLLGNVDSSKRQNDAENLTLLNNIKTFICCIYFRGS